MLGMDISETNAAQPLADQSATPQRKPLPFFDRSAWRDATIIWLIQHASILALTYLAATFIFSADPSSADPFAKAMGGWFGWDAANYAKIATNGYYTLWTASYYPLFPAIEHVGSLLLGGNASLAGLLVNLVLSFVAFGQLRVLAERELGRETAQRVTLYLALFPAALFLFAPYTEALFLVLSLGAFLALRQGRWLVAGAFITLATLSRAQGVLLLLPLVAEYVARSGILATPRFARIGAFIARISPESPLTAENPRPAAPFFSRRLLAVFGAALAPVLAYGGLILYLHNQFGLWNASSLALQRYWDRDITAPFIGFARAIHALIQAGTAPTFFQAHILVDMAFALFFIALAVAAIGRMPLPYLLFTWASLLLVLSTPGHGWSSLTSDVRYMLVTFPLFFLLGQWGKRREVELAILLTFVPLFVVFVITFIAGKWVA